MSTKITCPKCEAEIEITEVMSAQLAGTIRAELEAELAPKRKAVEAQVRTLKEQQAAVALAKAEIDKTVATQLAARLDSERDKLMEQARTRAAEDMAVEIKDRDEQLKTARATIMEAEQRELSHRKRERELVAREQQVQQQQEQIQADVQQQLAAERQRLIDQGQAKASERLAIEIEDRDRRLAENAEKLQSARDEQLEWRKREREMKQQIEESELTVARRVAEEADGIRAEAAKKAAEQHELKDAEKDKKITDLVKQLDEMKRRAEQGSQKSQGDVLEESLESLLKRNFPTDGIEIVGRGVAGADVIQRVRSTDGADCGVILWETKSTKRWQDAWLPKLRQDQREQKAVAAVLVSTILPEGIEHFGEIDRVWVCGRHCAAQIAAVLRAGLIEVAKASRALQGQQSKMELVYEYLASPEFSNRVNGVMEALVTMRRDLESEKQAIQTLWAKRAKQLEQAVLCTVTMCGDIKGIIGAALPEIEGLSLAELDAGPPPRRLLKADSDGSPAGGDSLDFGSVEAGGRIAKAAPPPC